MDHTDQPSRPLRILALTHCPPAEPCTFARIYTPLRALQAAGKVEYELHPIWPWKIATFQRLLRDLATWDVVWIARPRHYLMLPIIAEARRVGTPVLVDMDDWLLERPDSFDALQWVGTHASRKTMRAAILGADVVTASTSTIAERSRMLGASALVVANAVNCRQFVRHPRGDDPNRPLTIAFCGTIAHRDDIPLIALALRTLLRERQGRVRVVTVACPIPALQGLPGYTHHDFVPATDYPRFLSDLRIDIGLAPLYDTEFNRARSDIKYLEYSATGAATIASTVVPYQDSMRPDRGVLVAENKPEAWNVAIAALVDNAEHRQQLADNAYSWVRAERSIEATAHKWFDVFNHYAVAHTNARAFGSPRRSLHVAGSVEQVLEHVVLRQVPYYGLSLPPLLLKKALSGASGRAQR